MGDHLDRRLVAVVFTDMVGYTAMMQADETQAVERRDTYVNSLREAHDEFGGTIVQLLGDGSMSMFGSAVAAIQAATRMQQHLVEAGVAVRIGIHVGDVIVEPERLTGAAVNIAARVESFAAPSSILISDAAREQVVNHPEIELRDLGQFKFKNVGRPLSLYAVVADGVHVPNPADLEGKGERLLGLPNNLGDKGAALIGRSAELDELAAAVRVTRLVTLTGPGGVGKTSVMVALGRMVAAEFDGGVGFISLVDVTDAQQFMGALAETLDVKEAEERSFAEGVAALIGDSNALLLLDNFEQIIDAAMDIAWLLDRCPSLHIVVTSRTPLRVLAEREYPLTPLAVPDEARTRSPLELEQFPAIGLLVERAQRARPGFALDESNAPAVVEICRRLDGLPLALELAAARLRLLTPAALLERLDHALEVLTVGSRDSHSRQQTLRATIDWSHSLLEASEQQLFRRLAVFVGGCTFEDAEIVCAADGASILDDVESLVDKALVVLDPATGRLRMLQTILEYAQEQLSASGERTDVENRHAARFAAIGREIGDGIEGADQLRSLDRGIAEEANIIAALDRLLARARSGDAAAREMGMTLTGDVLMYWHLRGKNLSARDYAQAFLATDVPPSRSVGRIGALMTAGLASWMLGLFDQSNAEWQEAYEIAVELKSTEHLASMAALKGLGMFGVDIAEGIRTTDESISRCAEQGMPWWGAFAATVNGMLHAMNGDAEQAKQRYMQAFEVQRRLGDAEGTGLSTSGLAALAAAQTDFESALEWYRQALASFEACRDRAEEARVLSEMAWTYLAATDVDLARWYFFESAGAYTDVASVRGVGLSLVGLAACESVDGSAADAVAISAAAEVYAKQEGIVNVYGDENAGRDYLDAARNALSEPEVVAAESRGRGMSLSDALSLARR